MAELLTDEIIIEKLEGDGFMEEPDAPWILEYINTEYGGKLDTTSDWAKGYEDRLIYYQSTADSYDVFISTESHDHKDIYFEQDVYYYCDHAQFAEDLLNSITYGGSAWCDPNLWDDIEFEFNHELEQWWTDIYNEYWDQYKQELLDSGEYYEEKED
jgi:hypothetical protein